MEDKLLNEILKSKQTVFSFKELSIKFKSINQKNLKSKLHYFVDTGDLHNIRRGLYSKDLNYNKFELATKIFIPSYISFETVLSLSGIVFQFYSQIFVASYQSRNIICDNNTYVFRRIKPIILTNSLGIEILDEYSIATPERAFLDIVYHTKNYYFDNLEPLNWDKIYEILPIYGDNKSMRNRVDKYYKSLKI